MNLSGNQARSNIGMMLNRLADIYTNADHAIDTLRDQYFSWADRVRGKLEGVYHLIDATTNGITDHQQLLYNAAVVDFRALEDAARSVGFNSFTDLALEAAKDLPSSFKQVLKDTTGFAGDVVGNVTDAAGRALGKGIWETIKSLGPGGWGLIIVGGAALAVYFIGPGKLFKMIRG